MDKRVFDLNLRALVYQEGNEFHARCLEMDLLGAGRTEKDALKHLREAIEDQISFAVFKNDDGLIMFRADQEYFQRWENANIFRLHNELFPDKALNLNGKAIFISFTKDELEALKRSHRFSPAAESAIA